MPVYPQLAIPNQNTRSELIQNYLNIQDKKQFEYIIESVKFLEDFFKQNRNNKILISFNGGKDATMVLILSFIALFNINNLQHEQPLQQNLTSFPLPQCIYFEEPDPFQEMLQFNEQMKQAFDLKTISLKSKNYARQLTQLHKSTPFQAVIMGSRNDDPFCQKLELISKSDSEKGYPFFNRVNPIIKWKYSQVWKAIQALNMPYCKLYNEGYTSIGNRKNTRKNPDLEKYQKVNPLNARQQTQRSCRINYLPQSYQDSSKVQ